MLYELIPDRWVTLHSLVVVLGLVVYISTSHARRQRRHPSAAIAWVVSLILLPYLAIPLYLFIGNRKVVREPPPRPSARALLALPCAAANAHSPGVRYQQLACAMGLPAASSYQQLHIHQDGVASLQALRELIQSSTKTLDLCTFILGRDAVGEELAGLLMARARGGVRVRLLIDGIGRFLGGRPPLQGLRAAGVQVALFVSPFRSPLPGRTNLRNHRKLVIADGVRLWTGGRNLAAEYFTGCTQGRQHTAPWTDLSFGLAGELAQQAQARFELDWVFATQQKPASPPSITTATAPASAAALQGPMAQLVASGPDQADDTVYSLLIASCFSAQTRITAVSPYFVPDATLLMALTLAARRGVAVTLLLPRQSNHRLADMARNAALRDMAAAGAQVWLTSDMIHAKAIIIDDELALAGSANLDERSMFLNYELMFAFFDPADVHRFAHWVAQQREQASPYQARQAGVLLEFAEGLVRWLAFQL